MHLSLRRKQLLQIYNHALQAVHGRQSVARYLRQHQVFDKTPALIAIGKAAPAMVLGTLDVFKQIPRGLLITKQGLLTQTFSQNIICIESGHPIPNQHSIEAGKQLIDFIKNIPVDTPILCLISGGASALVEVLAEGVTLANLQRVNQYLLSSGLDIQQMNAVRQQLSCIKGGQLTNYFRPQHKVLSLYISDVPNDDLSVIGSGLLVAAEPLTELHTIQQIFTTLNITLPVKKTNKQKLIIEHHIVASSRIARLAALQMAQQLNIQPIHYNEDLLLGDVFEAADSIMQQLKQRKGLFIYSSETTVQLPEKIGKGGRCQTLALAIAQRIANNEQYCVLAGSTDGNDGSHFVAGALVDGQTLHRGKMLGLDADNYLQRADAGVFLNHTGDLIDTGETGTNVMDLILAWRE